MNCYYSNVVGKVMLPIRVLNLCEYCPVSNKFKQFAFLWLKQNKKQIIKYVL